MVTLPAFSPVLLVAKGDRVPAGTRSAKAAGLAVMVASAQSPRTIDSRIDRAMLRTRVIEFPPGREAATRPVTASPGHRRGERRSTTVNEDSRRASHGGETVSRKKDLALALSLNGSERFPSSRLFLISTGFLGARTFRNDRDRWAAWPRFPPCSHPPGTAGFGRSQPRVAWPPDPSDVGPDAGRGGLARREGAAPY
jgi:hypothetical protein